MLNARRELRHRQVHEQPLYDISLRQATSRGGSDTNGKTVDMRAVEAMWWLANRQNQLVMKLPVTKVHLVRARKQYPTSAQRRAVISVCVKRVDLSLGACDTNVPLSGA